MCILIITDVTPNDEILFFNIPRKYLNMGLYSNKKSLFFLLPKSCKLILHADWGVKLRRVVKIHYSS